jgi:hypothetical protein
MAGMEGLGRVFNVVPIAEGLVLKFRGASAVSYVCTGADTYVISVGTDHSAAATDPGDIINHYYKTLAKTDGTVKWTKYGTDGTAWATSAQASSNQFIIADAACGVATVFTSMIPDTYQYIKCDSGGGPGLVMAIFHDLVVQRSPLNLEILNA